nr:hypothetical protein [Nocardiopsis alborubida]
MSGNLRVPDGRPDARRGPAATPALAMGAASAAAVSAPAGAAAGCGVDHQPNDDGALPDAPIPGHPFSAQFQELLANAHPPVQ